jgi:hypothetical protein
MPERLINPGTGLKFTVYIQLSLHEPRRGIIVVAWRIRPRAAASMYRFFGVRFVKRAAMPPGQMAKGLG